MPQEDGGPVKHRPKVHNSAIRKENWKLVRLNEKIASDDPAPPWKLYDLVTDIEERNDVADQHDDIVRALSAQFNRWRSSMHPTVESLKEEQPDRLGHSPCTIWRRTRPRSPIFGM
jgi:arylsulfatase A-like enzyme